MTAKQITTIFFALGALFIITGTYIKVMESAPDNLGAAFKLAGFGFGILAFSVYILNKGSRNPDRKY